MQPYGEHKTVWKKEEKEPWYGDREILVALITGAVSTVISLVNLYITLFPPIA